MDFIAVSALLNTYNTSLDFFSIMVTSINHDLGIPCCCSLIIAIYVKRKMNGQYILLVFLYFVEYNDLILHVR